MLQFSNPIWLFGIGAVIIPLIIHLWNVKTGKTIKVGSISLMGESSRQNSRSLKFRELLLLLLRCLILVILSALLAEPIWRSASSTSEQNAWVLMEKDKLPETYKTFKREIDSLTNAGSEFHFLEPGFQKNELAEILKDSSQTSNAEHMSYWSLLKLLDQVIPANTKAYLFTSDRQSRFSGPRPQLSAGITWKTYTPADSISRWLENAYMAAPGGIRISQVESSPSGIVKKAVNLKPGESHPEVKVVIREGKPVAEIDGRETMVDTATLKLAIYTKEFPGDEEYLRAAVGAIQSYTSRKIKLVAPTSQKDFLFWLSATDIPAAIVNTISPGGKVLKYGKGKTTAINSWIETQTAQLSTAPPALHKRLDYPIDTKAFAIWEDGFGEPLLTLSTSKNSSWYTLYTHLDPTWTDLVWSPDFVSLLMPLILPDTVSTQQEQFDTRSSSSASLLQSSKLRAQSPIHKTENRTSLSYYGWLLLLLVFLAERWLSFKNLARA